jgi:hypothetical protein
LGNDKLEGSQDRRPASPRLRGGAGQKTDEDAEDCNLTSGTFHEAIPLTENEGYTSWADIFKESNDERRVVDLSLPPALSECEPQSNSRSPSILRSSHSASETTDGLNPNNLQDSSAIKQAEHPSAAAAMLRIHRSLFKLRMVLKTMPPYMTYHVDPFV